MSLVPLRGVSIPFGLLGLDAVETHQSGHTVLAAPHPLTPELPVDPGAAVCPPAGSKDRPDPCDQGLVCHLSLADRPFLPGIIAAPGYIQHPTQSGDGKDFTVGIHKGKPHLFGREKIATAFFKMSRSWRRISFSRSSSRSVFFSGGSCP